ncbi:MAG: AMP-binding protein [Desulfobacterales bacterium]
MKDDKGPVYSEECLCVTALPLYHCFGLNVTLISPLSVGGTVILIKRFSPDTVLEAITHHKANIFAGVPTMYAYMAQVYDPDKHDLSSIRFSCSAGAALPDELVKAFKEKTGVRIIQGYGITEASAQAIAPPLKIDTSVQKVGTIGLPLRNKEEVTEAEIFDDNDQKLPPNELGELVIKGRHVMKGYWGMPEETNNTIRNGWLHTGDLAKKDEDDYLYIVDRKKDIIIVGGENVVPKEVEEVLYQNSNILEAAVVGVPDSMKGEVIKAVVALKKEARTTEEEIRNYCEQRLAKFKVPEFIEFREELPKSATGKILRKDLKS